MYRVYCSLLLLVSAGLANADDLGGPITSMKVDLEALVEVGAVRPVQGMSSSGVPGPEALQVFHDNGYVAVIDLRTPAEKSDDEVAESVAGLGMAYESLPIDGPGAITFENARKLSELMSAHNGPVLVHCASGNRVGALVALQQSLSGADDDMAIAVGAAAGLTSLEPVVRQRLTERRPEDE